MKIKGLFKGFVLYFSLVFIVFLFSFILLENKYSFPSVAVFKIQELNSALLVLVATLVWLMSPVGFLSFIAGGCKTEKCSLLKRKMISFFDVLSMLTWISIMLVLMIVYVDDLYLHIFDMGSNILYLVIVSGFVFGFIFILKIIFMNNFLKIFKKSNKTSEDMLEGEIVEEDENYSSFEVKNKKGFLSRFKDKFKGKIKEDLKEIINDEIDRRF